MPQIFPIPKTRDLPPSNARKNGRNAPIFTQLTPRFRCPASGFSLVELLVVIGLIVLIAGFASSALRGIAEGNSHQKALIGISSALENARQSAVANGTYTWVAMSNERDPESRQNVVTVATLASKDGTRGSSVADPSNVRLLSKIEKFESVVLDDDPPSSSRLRLPNVNSVPASPSESQFQPDSKDLSNDYSKLQFNWVVMFTPRGEAVVDANPASGQSDADGDSIDLVEAIDFAVIPSRGENPSPIEEKSAAAIRINGLTGQVDVYQAQAGS